MFRFILFLSSLIFLLIYFQSAFDNLSQWIKGNGLLIAVAAFIGSIALSYYQKKPLYSPKTMSSIINHNSKKNDLK